MPLGVVARRLGSVRVALTPSDAVRAAGLAVGACLLNGLVPKPLRVRCPFEAATSWPCPFCDASAAARALAMGRLGRSVGANPLPVAGAAAAVLVALRRPDEVVVDGRLAAAVLVCAWALKLGGHRRSLARRA